MLRTSFSAAALLCLASTAFAAGAPPHTKPALDLTVKPEALDFDLKPEAVQFLDKSVVRVPKSTGKYTLVKASYDAKDRGTGVSTDWRVAGAPEGLVLSVFAYPIGRGPEDEVVQREIAKVATAIQIAQQQGLSSDAHSGERAPFVVVRPEPTAVRDEQEPLPPFNPAPKSEATPKPGPDADEIVKLKAKYKHSLNSHGIRQAFGLKLDGVPMRSLAYVFYRNLFGLKVRISVPEKAIDQAGFEKLADEATRWLVPQLDVQNFGTCGNITVYHEPPGIDFETWAKDSLAQGFERIRWENCDTVEDKRRAQPKNVEKIEIVYPPHTWNES